MDGVYDHGASGPLQSGWRGPLHAARDKPAPGGWRQTGNKGWAGEAMAGEATCRAGLPRTAPEACHRRPRRWLRGHTISTRTNFWKPLARFPRFDPPDILREVQGASEGTPFSPGDQVKAFSVN